MITTDVVPAKAGTQYAAVLVVTANAGEYWILAFAGDDTCYYCYYCAPSAHNPSTALVMMLRWISLEPP